jgi:hypothetical protein
VTVSISIDGLPEVKRRIEGLTGRQMQNKLRRAVRAGAKPMQASLKVMAAAQPTGKLPHTFKRVPAAKVSASARRGGQIVASVKPKSALFNIFEPGAEAHEIGGGAETRTGKDGRTRKVRGGRRTSGMLAGPSGIRGRSKDFFVRGAVKHPGMKARPIRVRAFDAGKPLAKMAIASVLLEAD